MREHETVLLTARVGSLTFPNPVMTAAGTAGHGAELGAFQDLAGLGAVVVKSLSAAPWAGNPAPRVAPTTAGMLNSVGLQGAGVEAWLRHDLPALAAAGARVVVSIWGRSLDDFLAAAALLADAPADIVAVEINVSCPNLEARSELFAHSPEATASVVAGVRSLVDRPCWAKLSPNTDQIVPVAAAAAEAGAEAVVLINTVVGMVLDPSTLRPVLGARRGGLSGAAIHPVAVRAVWDVHEALPELAIIGAGGVRDGWTAVELLAAGASAVQVGTATFADPAAPTRVRDDLRRWCSEHGHQTVAELVGIGHTDRGERGR